MLLSLAPELIQAISHELNAIEDIKSFRLACKQTGQALSTEVLHHITININTETLERELSKLHYLASAPKGSSLRPAIQGIRQVDIKSLSPAQNHKGEWIVIGGKDSAEDDDGDVDRTLEMSCHEVKLKKCLYNALSSLTTVRTIKWSPTSKDRKWAHTAVMDALKTLPNLQSLSVGWGYRIDLPFHFFTTLQHISVQCVDEGNTFENLIQMISQSPLLKSIDFTYAKNNSLPRNLYQLFERYPEDGVPPLRLKHLSLANCLIRLDDKTVMRHLRYLTSLSLKDYMDPLSRVPISETHNQEIWRTVSNAGLRLEEITLYNTPSAFVEYLGSYSGLKKLIIHPGRYKNGIASDIAGKKFYEALEKHASSIEELDVDTYYEGLWCFGHHNKALFSTLQNLRTLSVKVQSSDLVRKSEVGRTSRQDIIEVLLDTIVMYIPQLQALFVSIGDSDSNRYNRCGGPSGYHCLHYNKKIVARVLKYKAPWGFKRLPILKVSMRCRTRVFVGQSPDPLKEGGRLGYHDISSSHKYPDNVDSDTEEEKEEE